MGDDDYVVDEETGEWMLTAKLADADNARRNFADQDSYYGQVVNGVVLGTGSRGQ